MKRCPVCLRAVQPTMHNNIAAHRDSIGGECPAVGEPYRIAVEAAESTVWKRTA